ncbi:MAG: TlpA disulfide reductase family protein [Acidimicrobiia bacterium]|nr:TlpA disulfide reductase family protein [Acidimicrobiia bacterium]
MRNSRRIAGVVMALVVLVAACSGGGGEAEAPSAAGSAAAAANEGDPIPTTPFETFAGEPATLADYSGKPLVVNFWASWCPSCVAEMSAAFLPAQLALGDQVAFLGVNIQDERDKALELVAETGVLFDLAEDPVGELYTELGGLGMPFTVYISPAGRVLDVHNGPLTESQLVAQITEVLLS